MAERTKKQQTILLYSERKKKSRSEFHPTILLVSAILHIMDDSSEKKRVWILNININKCCGCPFGAWETSRWKDVRPRLWDFLCVGRPTLWMLVCESSSESRRRAFTEVDRSSSCCSFVMLCIDRDVLRTVRFYLSFLFFQAVVFQVNDEKRFLEKPFLRRIYTVVKLFVVCEITSDDLVTMCS